MSKDPLYEQLREISWRRKLTPAEEAKLSAWLAAHPEAQADWDAENSLNQALAALPDVAVASNFTSRVLDAAQRDGARSQGRVGPSAAARWWSRWLPKAAFAAVLLTAGLLSYHHTQDLKRAQWAQSLTTLSQVPPLPTDVLKDFDAIAALSSTAADEELLQVMQ